MLYLFKTTLVTLDTLVVSLSPEAKTNKSDSHYSLFAIRYSLKNVRFIDFNNPCGVSSGTIIRRTVCKG